MSSKLLRRLALASALTLGAFALGSCPNTTMTELNAKSVYTVRVYPAPEHGALTLSGSYVVAGDWITVYVNPEPGYTLKANGLKSYVENAVDLAGKTFYLKGARYQTQIGANTRITAEFEPVAAGYHTVHIDSGLENGIIFSNPLSAAAGTTVTLTLVPEPGYGLVSGSLRVNGAALPDSPPYTFSMPDTEAAVQAEFVPQNFNELKASAWNYLTVKQYDTAAAFYEEAWNKNPGDPDTIFYASVAKLATLLVDPDVRSILGTFHMPTPGTLDDWVCDGYSDGEKWYTTYTGTYSIGTTNYAGRDIPLPWLSPASWGFVTPYSDFAISQDPVNHIQKFKNHLFWGLIAAYTRGFNPLIENILRDVFGREFEEAAARAASFPADAKVQLHPALKARFGLEQYYGAGTTYVGKAELDYIFGVMRAVKAAVEYLSTYDLTIDMRNWLITEIMPTDGLDEVLQKMFLLSDRMSGARKELWQDYPTVVRMLPFRNNFLRSRNSAAMPRAREGLALALNRLNASFTHWYGADNGSGSSPWTAAAQTKNTWAKNGLAAARTALDGNGVFYFPGAIPDEFNGSEWVFPAAGWDWPTGATPDTPNVKVYGLSVDRFFTPGAFTLQNLFVTEMGGEAPQLWQIEWYEDRDANYATVYTGNKRLVAEPIERRGRQDNVVGDNFAPYGKFSFLLNTRYLKTLFPHGFETYEFKARDGDPVQIKNTGDAELLSDMFPHIAMWQWAPSCFGNTITATQLYYWYHLR
jgi:hypothetical protein